MAVSKMIIRANQKYIDMSCVKHLLACGEKNADHLTFEVSKNYNGVDLSECTFILRAVNSNRNLMEQTLSKQVKNDSVFLTWTVDEYFTAVSGILKLEIRGIKGDELVIKYNLSDIFVRESAVGEGLPQPDMIEKAVSEMLEILEKSKEISVKAPVIQNDTWWIFNSETLEYEDSGLPSRGERGLQGVKGDKGDTGKQGLQGIQGERGKTGANGKSAYQIWLEFGNTGSESDFIASLKGDKGDKGDTGKQGLQGIQGERGKTGADGKSAYQTWLELGNTGSESDFIVSLKGDKGDNGESGSGDAVVVDSELSDTSENPVQNKIINHSISLVWNEIAKVKDLIQSMSLSATFTTLFDSENYTEYSPYWNFKNSQWGDTVYSFDETVSRNPSFCSEKNNYCISFSNAFGWGANITAVCSRPFKINGKSTLRVDYTCTSDGDGMTAEIVSLPDFNSGKVTEFEVIPAFYVAGTFISATFNLASVPENGEYYLRLKVNTTNPNFTVRKISVG